MDNKKRQTLIAAVGLLGLLAIISGVTYAFLNYSKRGTQDNVISSGRVKFLYTEVDGIGAGISMVDALPMTDAQGQAQTGTNSYFDFTITADSGASFTIPYTVTARVSSDSDLDPDVVKVWLSDPTSTPEEEIEAVKFFGATNTTKASTDVLARYTAGYAANYNERVLYTGEVPKDSNGEDTYSKSFRLRIWIDNDTDFSPTTVVTAAHCSVAIPEGTEENQANCEAIEGASWVLEETAQTNQYSGKKFTITVNVYANGRIVEENVVYDAAEVSYTNSLSTACTASEDQTVECALNELSSLLQ